MKELLLNDVSDISIGKMEKYEPRDRPDSQNGIGVTEEMIQEGVSAFRQNYSKLVYGDREVQKRAVAEIIRAAMDVLHFGKYAEAQEWISRASAIVAELQERADAE